MIELLVVLLVAVAYALGRARDERDRLLLRLCEVRPGRWPQREHRHTVEEQLAAERLVWRQTAAVQRAAHEAMREAVASAAQPPPTPRADMSVVGVGERHRRAMAAMAPAGLSADEVQSQVKPRQR